MNFILLHAIYIFKSIKTRAVPSPDGKAWILNGSKIWISNGKNNQYYHESKICNLYTIS